MATHLEDLCDTRELRRLIDDGFITARTDRDGELVIYNYTPAAQYTPGAFGIWEVRLARGLVTTLDGQVVARGFTKFGNLAEHSPGSPYGPLPTGERAVITEKLDGALGIVFRHRGRLRVTTRGSFNSPQARWAQHWLDTQVDPAALTEIDGASTTLCVEILSPASRVVVRYDRDELVALAAIDHATGRDVPIPDGWTHRRVTEHHDLSVDEVFTLAGTNPDGSENREGFVVRFEPSGTRVKVKFGEYLRLHRIMAGLHRQMVWEHWALSRLLRRGIATQVEVARAVRITTDELTARLASGGDPLTELLGVCPDEAVELIRDEVAELEANLADHQARLDRELQQVAGVSRSDVAAALAGSAYTSAVFAHLSGKDPDMCLVRLVEPPAEQLLDRRSTRSAVAV